MAGKLPMISTTSRILARGEQSLPYTLRRHRRARRVTLRVDEDGLTVTVPWNLPMEHLEAYLETKWAWIEETTDKHKQRLLPAQWREGDRLLLLGSERSLVYREGIAKISATPSAVIIPQHFCDQPGHIELSLQKWFIDLARQDFAARIEQLAHSIGVQPQRIVLRNQKTRWGSCSARGTISLNWRLIMAPPEIINYVIVHEMSHLLQMNHSPEFWSVVKQHDPGYQRHRDWLRAHGHRLILRPCQDGSRTPHL